MYRLLVPLVLTGAALAQMPGPIAFPVFPPPLKDYLALTDQQVQNLLRNNADYNRFVIEKQLRAAQVQREIATETQREQLDPMALGLRYVELEAINREIRDRLKKARDTALAGVTDAQKVKLKALEDARALQPVITAAECQNLLAPQAASTISQWFDTGAFITPAIGSVMFSNCGTAGMRNGDFSGIITAP